MKKIFGGIALGFQFVLVFGVLLLALVLIIPLAFFDWGFNEPMPPSPDLYDDYMF